MLQEKLEHLVATFDVTTITPDPLEVVLRFDRPADQEIAGIIAAAFAYGRADIVVRNAGSVLQLMGKSPHRYLARRFTPEEALERFATFSHRFHKTRDLVALLECLAGAVRHHGSLGRLFREQYDPCDQDITPTLARFVETLIGLTAGSALRRSHPELDKSLRYLLTSPTDGSACKRMHLFLRWMIRRESPDLGIWSFADPAKLVMPLDTHVHRISTFLGLTTRKSADGKTARELTDALAKFDATDPTKFDFAICRLGILDLCSRKRRRENCDVCLLRDVCRFPVK